MSNAFCALTGEEPLAADEPPRPLKRQKFAQWHAQHLPEPECSFLYMSSCATHKYTNDFVANRDAHGIKPIHTSVLMGLDGLDSRGDALLLAYSGSKIPGALADIQWADPRAVPHVQQYAVTVPSARPDLPIEPTLQPTLNSVGLNPADWAPVEVQGRMLLRTRLDDIQRLCGQNFTLDASCSMSGIDKQFPRSCANKEGPNALGPLAQLSTLENEVKVKVKVQRRHWQA